MTKLISHIEHNNHSLRKSLLIWFLLLTLVPLCFVSWIGYQQVMSSTISSAHRQLVKDVSETTSFFKDWFSYRFIDLKSQSRNFENVNFLKSLTQASNEYHGKVDQFVASDSWRSYVKQYQQNLLNFVDHYDYAEGVLLIDLQGNILYSTETQHWLGVNLFASTADYVQLSQTVRLSLQDKKPRFSDMMQDPFNRSLIGFFIAPVTDYNGSTYGLIAIKTSVEQINYFLRDRTGNNSLIHYVVGSDGIVRASANLSNELNMEEADGISLLINGSVTWRSQNSLANEKLMAPEVQEYIDIQGNRVLGTVRQINVPGINWYLISEMDFSEVTAPVGKLMSIILFALLLTVGTAVLIASYQARHITRPIIALANASLAVAEGKTLRQVDIGSNNEIGVLAKAFNHMLKERYEYEQAVEKSQQKTKKAMADLAAQKFALDQHAIVAVTDVKGDITFVNDKFTEISGYNRKELISKNHRLLNSGYHDAEFFRQMYRTIAQGKVWHGEICNKAKDGRRYWVDTTIVPFFGDNGKPESYIAIRADITERKKAEMELRGAKEAAEAATRQKSDFLANMSHEIRTPMNGIIGMTGLLLETELTSKQRSYAVSTQNSADALLTIINDILDFSKIEAGKLELENVPFDLQVLAEDVAEFMAVRCREKGLELMLRYKPGTHRFVSGDPGRVRQILLNLLSNAIKFTDQGFVHVNVEDVEVHSNSVLYKIAVTDTGIGIADEKLGLIFNKFDQEDSSTTRKYGGTGLGLAICQQLSAMMGGEVNVESQKGKGSTFSFTMNLDLNQQPPVPIDESQFEALSQLRVLVIDNAVEARNIVVELLDEMRFESIVAAGSDAEALEILQQVKVKNTSFDIVIMDNNSTLANAENFISKIHQHNLLPSAVLIYVTSLPQKGEGSNVKQLGFDGYLTKPIHPSELPKILCLVWDAKSKGQDMSLVTRHTIKEAEVGKRQKPVLTNCKILLTEDNPVNVAVATELLESYGCKVTPAGNGLEAVALVQERQFDLIFMDCQMPEMDGFEATQKIRELQKYDERTPIIAFTANAMKSDQEKCLLSGMNDFISKPVNQETLENTLVKWLPHKIHLVTSEESEEIGEQTQHKESVTNNDDENEAMLDEVTFSNLKKLFGDRFSNTVNTFVNNSSKNLTLVEKAIQDKDFETLERAAHSIKGSSGQFGAQQLSRLAAEMEQLAKDKSLDEAKKLFKALQQAQLEVTQFMLAQISNEGGGN